MYIVYFDSGTTNTRAYLIKERSLIGSLKRSVGSKDSAQTNTRSFLLTQLHQLYQDLLDKYQLTDQAISAIYMSGMVSSPNGIVEIPHLSTPVNSALLKKSIVTHLESEVFKRKLFIIPGIKTVKPNDVVDFSNIESVNNMRGEEIELFGMINSSELLLSAKSVILLPGSHTQIAFIEQDYITDILSTITGELFHAIVKETLIGPVLETGTDWEPDAAMVQEGYRCLKEYGFNRALYIIRTMTLFLESTARQRTSFMEGILHGGVIDAIDHKVQSCEQHPMLLGIAGDSFNYQIFKAITTKYFPHITTLLLNEDDEIPASVKGLLHLLHS